MSDRSSLAPLLLEPGEIPRVHTVEQVSVDALTGHVRYWVVLQHNGLMHPVLAVAALRATKAMPPKIELEPLLGVEPELHETLVQSVAEAIWRDLAK